MFKRFCDICKVELDRDELIHEIKLPLKNLKICPDCLKELTEYIENKSNNFKIETTRYEKGYTNKWEEVC